MTAYALYGLIEARRAGIQVDEWRIANGTRALAQLYASIRAPNRTSRPTWPTCCRATAGKEPGSRWYADGAQARYDARRSPSTSCGARAAG